MNIPMEHELISFFGSTPALTDDLVPWVYNHVKFSTKSGGDTVIFEIEPASGEVRFRCLQGERKTMELILDRVDSLSLDDGDSLVVHFEERVDRGELRLRIKPSVSVFWDARPN